MKTRTEIIGETNWYEVAQQCYYGYMNGDIDALHILDYYAEVLADYECCSCLGTNQRQYEELTWVHEWGGNGSFYCEECSATEGVIDHA
tara:strand:- start:71 stop:337 length:267 start_codon:yes stop_codon:yes gene_type:complete